MSLRDSRHVLVHALITPFEPKRLRQTQQLGCYSLSSIVSAQRRVAGLVAPPVGKRALGAALIMVVTRDRQEEDKKG